MRGHSFSRIYRVALRRWPLFAPFVTVGLELALQVRHPFVLYHYWIALRDQPLRSVLELSLSLARLYVAVALLAAAADLVFRLLATKVAGLGRPSTKLFCFLALYAIGARTTFVLKPAISGAYYLYYPKWLFLLASLGALWCLLRFRRSKQELVPQEWPARSSLWLFTATLALAPTLLLLVPASRRTQQMPPSSTKGPEKRLPSFLLIGLDGIPGDVFSYGTKDAHVAPRWFDRWREQAIEFPTAYTVTNSTYTSWFSVLSGLYPHESRVQTLYPNDRDGQIPTEELLPKRLLALGYRTAFLTDCGATSYMRPEFGFDYLDQAGLGIFDCGRSLLLSLHPASFLAGSLGVFPELSSFCSATYQPERFFSRVDQLLRELDKGDEPYFVAFHSCLTHQQLFSHTPPVGSLLRERLPFHPEGFNQRLTNLELSVRYADSLVDKLLETRLELRHAPWTFLLSDHGLRIDLTEQKLTGFTHGVGDPVNRYQYRIPLALIPGSHNDGPSIRTGVSRPEVASLLDIFPTVSELAGLPQGGRKGSSLLPLLEGRPSGLAPPLLLSSAIPIHLSADNHELIDVFLQNRIDRDGHHYFPPDLESKILTGAPVGYLRWPYRLLVQSGRPVRLFHEDTDPFNANDISLAERDTVRQLALELCEKFPEPWCRTRAGLGLMSKLPRPKGYRKLSAE